MTSHPGGPSTAAKPAGAQTRSRWSTPRLNDLDRVEHRHTITSGGAAEPALDTQESIRGVQYRAIRYTDRLAEAEAVASVGSKGDSYDNAMAEALNSLFKAECIRNPAMRPTRGWKSVTDVEIAVAEYVDWFNHRRLHGELGLVPPAEFETSHRAQTTTVGVRRGLCRGAALP